MLRKKKQFVKYDFGKSKRADQTQGKPVETPDGNISDDNGGGKEKRKRGNRDKSEGDVRTRGDGYGKSDKEVELQPPDDTAEEEVCDI